ncbi:uncharacterized protein EAF02_008399 [Botrytis sinoallii]|uniref:uncharacterized protein n=1 Tax=Botrytis sinoallii TaxID=1463999 RepID=UPI0019007B7E|nr:uncharacterized protein EAF02_008399 [Botrytis sinoallii]KAF7874422.1 hypothetical protein EAF02_008399 [Botrytis sinoallii]
MCLIRPFRYTCCDRTYVEVSKLDSSCPDGWPLEKCPEDLCLVHGSRVRDQRWLLQGTCWRCQAMSEGLEGDDYEARRPPIDNAFVVEGLENCSPEGRRRRTEHAGNCWFCGASSDGVRDCESCDGTGCASKGKNKAVEDVPECPVKKKRRTTATVAGGGISKPRRGNNSYQQGQFRPDIPESSYNNYSWQSAEQNGDPSLPSYGMDVDDDPYAGQSHGMPVFTVRAPLHQYGTMADYEVNPQQVERYTMGYQDHPQSSIEFDHEGSHGEFNTDDGGEGVRSDNLDTSENQFAFSTGLHHSHDATFLTHNDWPEYADSLTHSPSKETNNEFAPTHDTDMQSAGPDAQVAQMTVDRFTPQPRYLPSPTLSEAHIAQHAPPNNFTATSTSTPAFDFHCSRQYIC